MTSPKKSSIWHRHSLLLLRRHLDLLVITVLAYLPPLTASPGRMPSDSKLYLYLDPQRLISDAPHAFDPRQFAGWVPHQHIAYLWPSGPWFAVFELLGIPDWIAHRLWIGTLLLVAGLGVRWLARLLGLSPQAALVAAVMYQLSPYLLPYVSRTSVMLLPWAGLGWIVGLTALAATASRWRHAAILALVVLSVGAVNATALAMIAPAPILWLIHAAWGGEITWRRAVATATRIGLLCLAVSLWWIAALVIQGRFGPDVLAFSEALEDVAFTSSAPEVLRGLGYWLFYLRDPFAAATTAAGPYLTSPLLIGIGFALIVISLSALVIVRWPHRRYAALLIAVGVVLAVGVYPVDDRSPLMSILARDTREGLALALRSSTRAVPMVLLGLALAVGSLVTAVGSSTRPIFGLRRILAPALVVLVVLNLPAAWSGGFVDPALERDQHPPAAWVAAAATLDESPPGYRVLQIPGAEFGAFRWGYTVDQPLPGLSDRPVVTRDLLPLGSPGAMDLLYALDDRFQRRTTEPDSLAPVARLLGADWIWLANDLAYDRFRTPRPDLFAVDVRTGAGLGASRGFGTRVTNQPVVPMLDEEAVGATAPGMLPTDAQWPVELLPVDQPMPIIRVADREILIAGNGDGIVDAAAAGLLAGSEIIRSAAAVSDLPAAVATAEVVIVTDTNRARARHWRSSQDTTGYTESRPEHTRGRRATGDARLEWFDPATANPEITFAEFPHPSGTDAVWASATGYGEPFAYRPESRPAAAVDGDHSTAWTVADRADAIGQAITIHLDAPLEVEQVTLRQPDRPSGGRIITGIILEIPGRPPMSVALDPSSSIGDGQRIDIEPWIGPGEFTIRIASTGAEPDHPLAWQGVGFAEIDLGLGPSTEWIRLPNATLDLVGVRQPLAIVLTRERVGTNSRWRLDPEASIRRRFALPIDRIFKVEPTIRLSARAPDEVLGALIGLDDVVAEERLPGGASFAGFNAVDGDPTTWWISPFDPTPSSALEIARPIGASLSFSQPDDERFSTITAVRLVPLSTFDAADTAASQPEMAGEIHQLATGAPVDGRHLDVITVPAGFEAGARIEILELAPVTTVDRRYGETVVAPFALQLLDPEIQRFPSTEIDTGCRDDLLWIDDQAVPLRITGSTIDAISGKPMQVAACDGSTGLTAGDHELITAPGIGSGWDIDRIVLASGVGLSPDFMTEEPIPEPPAWAVLDDGRTSARVQIDSCPKPCWLIFGQGFNPGWRATIDGEPLGAPELVNGGFNGWRLPALEAAVVVEISWGPQRWLTAALVASGLAVLVAAGLALGGGSSPAQITAVARLGHLGRRCSRRRILLAGLVWVVLAGLLISPTAGLIALVGSLVAMLLGRLTVIGAIGVIGIAGIGALMAGRVLRYQPVPDAGWVIWFADLNRPVLLALSAVVVAAIADAPAEEGP